MAEAEASSTETVTAAAGAAPDHGPGADEGHDGHVAHPKPSAYVGIAVILAIVTAAEVGLFYVESISDTWNTISLLVLMAIKFFLVATWFMHLRFESRIFRRLFYGGLVLAVAVYAVTLAASHVFPFGV